LNELPETLDETYERMLRDIDNQNWEYAHRLFQCLVAVSRPLLAKELAEFLAFDFSTGSTPTLLDDWRSEDPVHAVLSTCSSLLAIVDVDGSSFIQFSHFSVKEYLTSERLSQVKDIISRFHVSMTPAHTIIARACLGVLLHIDEKVTWQDLEKFPLAEYAAQHWVGHARFEGVSPNIQDGMKCLFDPKNHHFAIWVWIYDPGSSVFGDGWERGSQVRASPLHYAAFCGLHDVAKFLIVDRSLNVNARGFAGSETPLIVASRQGHYEVAWVLLKHGADTEIRDATLNAWNALNRASQYGHVGIVQALLEHGADVKAMDNQDDTALHVASGNWSIGYPAVARALLEHGADVNAKRVDNRTPLHFADEQVSCVLFEYGADPNAQDSNNRTPIHCAKNAHVAQVLLDYSANTNAQDRDNRTPLHHALKMNRPDVARLLLDNGADAHVRDSKLKTPLHLASRRGYLDLVQLLLQRGCSNIHEQDYDGRTPFQVASKNQRLDVMQLLLEHELMAK
jgi:ankyrin repeat protein